MRSPAPGTTLLRRLDGTPVVLPGRFELRPGLTGLFWFAHDLARPEGRDCVAFSASWDGAIDALGRHVARTLRARGGRDANA